MKENPSSMNKMREENLDSISTLPDAILTQSILTLLPTKDSVRTSVLSTRWRNLYASVPILDFQHLTRKRNIPHDTAFACFVSNVTNTVTRKLLNISRFRIHHDAPSRRSVLKSWVETAVSHHVCELDLHVVLDKLTTTPHCMFTCETLVCLKMNINIALSVPDFVILPKLKELFLKSIVLREESDDESIRKLFSSCPVLEVLVVDSWVMESTRILNVSVPSLMVFTIIESLSKINVYGILISCPNLEILRCKSYATGGYSGDMLRCLKKAYIDIELMEDQFKEGKLIDLVKQVCKVQFLSLAGDSMEALLIPPCPLPTFENLIHLELEPFYSAGWQMLASLLESSPCLKTLVFPRGFFERNHDEVLFSPSEHVPVCLASHLKLIRINRFFGDDEEYKMVEYFLTNALVLEKMEICPWSSEGSEGEESEVENEGEEEMEVEGDGDGDGAGARAGEGEGEGDGEGEGEGEDEDEKDEEFESDLERHFEITKRLLTMQRYSEVCQVVIVSSYN